MWKEQIKDVDTADTKTEWRLLAGLQLSPALSAIRKRLKLTEASRSCRQTSNCRSIYHVDIVSSPIAFCVVIPIGTGLRSHSLADLLVEQVPRIRFARRTNSSGSDSQSMVTGH